MTRAAVALMAIAACAGSPPPPRRPPPAPVAQKPLVPEPLAPEEAKDTFVYSPIGKRDPFRSPIDDLIITHAAESHCPLCRWEVDQLKLVAVITGTGNPVAMVEDPNGVGHMLRQGTAVGKLGGKVTSIQREVVVVTETSHDPFGKLVQNHSQLKIQQAGPDQAAVASPSLLNE
ncbi:MAG: pilus assembly protein PilP [Myxococcales bacterium]